MCNWVAVVVAITMLASPATAGPPLHDAVEYWDVAEIEQLVAEGEDGGR